MRASRSVSPRRSHRGGSYSRSPYGSRSRSPPPPAEQDNSRRPPRRERSVSPSEWSPLGCRPAPSSGRRWAAAVEKRGEGPCLCAIGKERTPSRLSFLLVSVFWRDIGDHLHAVCLYLLPGRPLTYRQSPFDRGVNSQSVGGWRSSFNPLTGWWALPKLPKKGIKSGKK